MWFCQPWANASTVNSGWAWLAYLVLLIIRVNLTGVGIGLRVHREGLLR